MLPEIEKLLVVQDRDTKIKSLSKDIDDAPKLIAAARKRLAADQQAVDDAKAAMFEIEKEIKNIEIDVQTRQTTIAKLKTQQFETRKNEEFTAFGNEVVRYENEISDLETKELEQMESLDTAKATLAEKREALTKVEESVNKEISAMEERIANRQKELDEFVEKRKTAAAGIPGDWMALYDRLLERKPPSVVPVDHENTCGGCHMKLTGNSASDARAERGIVQCGSCGRILYYPG